MAKVTDAIQAVDVFLQKVAETETASATIKDKKPQQLAEETSGINNAAVAAPQKPNPKPETPLAAAGTAAAGVTPVGEARPPVPGLTKENNEPVKEKTAAEQMADLNKIATDLLQLMLNKTAEVEVTDTEANLNAQANAGANSPDAGLLDLAQKAAAGDKAAIDALKKMVTDDPKVAAVLGALLGGGTAATTAAVMSEKGSGLKNAGLAGLGGALVGGAGGYFGSKYASEEEIHPVILSMLQKSANAVQEDFEAHFAGQMARLQDTLALSDPNQNLIPKQALDANGGVDSFLDKVAAEMGEMLAGAAPADMAVAPEAVPAEAGADMSDAAAQDALAEILAQAGVTPEQAQATEDNIRALLENGVPPEEILAAIEQWISQEGAVPEKQASDKTRLDLIIDYLQMV